MNKVEFITAVEAKLQFQSWVADEVVLETYGTVKKIERKALITTPDGQNVVSVIYIDNNGVVTWQNVDTLDPTENVTSKKMAILTDYLKANFVAYFLVDNHLDLDNNWAEAEVLTASGSDLIRSNVLVHVDGGLTHKIIG